MKQALVIIDIQNGFMNKNTAYLEGEIETFVQKTMKNPDFPMFDLIIGTQYVNHEASACYVLEGWKACMSGSEEAEICEKILPFLSEENGEKLIIKKDKYTCYTEEFLRLLKQAGIERIFMCGVNTGCCVLHSVLDVYEDVKDVYVLRDLCGSTTGPHYHEIAIELLETLITKERVIDRERFFEMQKYPQLLKQADALAMKAHKGQKDKAGADYITHPRTVASFLTDPEAQIVALLHDTIEDTEVTEEEIRALFGDRIADAVACMTHEEGVPYMDYIRKIKANPLAASVKLADLRHNMDLTRIKEPTDKDFDRLKKYHAAKALLENP